MTKEPPIISIITAHHWMSAQDFGHFVSNLPDYMFDNISRQDSTSLQRLERQRIAEEDGYPIRSIERPLTWPVNDLIPDELDYLQEDLQELGIDNVKIGTEIEFISSASPIAGNTAWLEKKEQILEQLSQEIEKAAPEKRTLLEEKKYAISEFTAREIMMYDLVEQDKRTRNILEPIFGKNQDGTGYYDGDNVLELKLKPVSPKQQIKNRKTTLGALYEKTVKYGLILENNPSYHLSFSFWKDGKNVFDPQNPEFTTRGKAIAEGMTSAAYDVIPTLISGENLNKSLQTPVSLSINRTSFLRFANERIELRPRASRDVQDTEAYLVFMLAGAVHGLKNNPDILPAKQITKAQIWHTPDHYQDVAQVIGNSVIGDDGYLVPPEKYVLFNAKKLALELGMIDKHSARHTKPEPFIPESFAAPTETQKYAPHILEFFKKTRIDSKAGKIIFPTTDGNTKAFASASGNPESCAKSFTISTPKDYGHLLPEKMISSVKKHADKKGLSPQDTVNAFAYKYMIEQNLLAKSIGNDPSNIDQTYTINVSALENSLQLADVKQALTITPGYDINDTSDFNCHVAPLSSARLIRMMESKALKETSPEFQTALKQTMMLKYPDILAGQAHLDTDYRDSFDHF